MKKNNLMLGSKIAKHFNKEYGIITYSGTLAIEIALKSIGLEKKSKILVSSNVCYSIINTILKVNMIPVIKQPKNNLYFEDEDINEIFKHQEIDCILLVHQFGLLNNIDVLKYKNMGIKIIEDVAQAWSINNKNQDYMIGKYSDVVVTSFGKTKPISYGIGGGLFFNDDVILKNIDFCDNTSRETQCELLSYAYPLCEQINYNALISLADKIVEEQRNNAIKYSDLLNQQKTIKYLDANLYTGNVWHRFPIWIDDGELYKKIVNLLKKSDLEYQLPHETELIDLPLCKECIKINCIEKKDKQILLRTRNVNIETQLNILKNILIHKIY